MFVHSGNRRVLFTSDTAFPDVPFNLLHGRARIKEAKTVYGFGRRCLEPWEHDQAPISSVVDQAGAVSIAQ